MTCCKIKVTVVPQETVRVRSASAGDVIKVAVGQGVAVYPDAPVYQGDYIVIPKAAEEVTLATADKLLLDDITIKEIPYYQTSNQSGGETVYIGSEVIIDGKQ